MKIIIAIMALCILNLGCSEAVQKKKKDELAAGDEPFKADDIVTRLSYPSATRLVYNGVVIADLASMTEVSSEYGQVLRGRTLNRIVLEKTEFLVYGEDGVFAAECETSDEYPGNGLSNPLCSVAHAESFNQIILCASRDQKTAILTAQNWPGVVPAMSNPSLGMVCWVNGIKMLSTKFFTY